MKKKTKILMAIYFIIVGVIVFTNKDITKLLTSNSNGGAKLELYYVGCGSAEHIPKPIPQLTSIAYTLLIVGTPIVLIAFSIISLVKATIGGNADDINKAKNGLFKKFLAAGIIFLLSGIFQFVLNKVTITSDDKNTTTSCLKCFLFYSSTNCHQSNSGHNDAPAPYRSQTNYGTTSNKNGYVMYVGDSRTIGMCHLSGESVKNTGFCRNNSEIVNAKVGAGYDWFVNTGVSDVDSILKSYNHEYKIIVMMGINDIYDDSVDKAGAEAAADKYYNYLLNKATNASWKNQKVIMTSVLPVNNIASQAKVDAFNERMAQRIKEDGNKIKYCDIRSFTPKYESDGVHYIEDSYEELYELVEDRCAS